MKHTVTTGHHTPLVDVSKFSRRSINYDARFNRCRPQNRFRDVHDVVIIEFSGFRNLDDEVVVHSGGTAFWLENDDAIELHRDIGKKIG